jgi:hypothetical protein
VIENKGLDSATPGGFECLKDPFFMGSGVGNGIPSFSSINGDGGEDGGAVSDGLGNGGRFGGWRKDWDEIKRGNGAMYI